MFDRIVEAGGRWFPERQIQIKSHGKVSEVTLPTLVQVSFVGVSVLSALVLGAVSMGAPAPQDGAGSEAAAISQLQNQLAEARQAAEAADARARELSAGRVAGLSDEAGRAAAEVNLAKLSERVQQLESELDLTAQQRADNKNLYEQASRQLDKATNDAKKLKAEHEKLLAEKGSLQDKLAMLEQEKTALIQAREKAERVVFLEQEKMRETVAELEHRLARKMMESPATPSVGVPDVRVPLASNSVGNGSFDIEHFLGQYGLTARPEGLGGPFVAMGQGQNVDPRQRAEAQRVLKTLPLTAPLDHYTLESRFGVRTDPFNGREAVHTGVDLSGPYKTPVFSTAPGVVVFAGYSNGYGNMVEIDHGMGIHTKYAHLNRVMVNAGQSLPRHAEVGLLGSTGRSTGPHVHYEVVVNGQAQDPEKFLMAGHSMGVLHTAY